MFIQYLNRTQLVRQAVEDVIDANFTRPSYPVGKKFTCNQCNYVCPQIKCAEHLGYHTNEKIYKCPHCDERFQILTELLEHYYGGAHDDPDESPDTIILLENKHVRNTYFKKINDNGRPMYICIICEMKLARPSITNHYNLGHNVIPRPEKCEKCGKVCTSRKALDAHVRLRHKSKDRVFECSVCKKSFSYKYGSQLCERRHNDEGRGYPCSQCAFICKNTITLASHMKNRHKSELKAVACKECSKTFGNIQLLKQHMIHHKRPELFDKEPCGICQKMITHMYMRSHQEKHSDKKKVQCDICGNCFSGQGWLKIHKQGHENLRPEACKICNKRFLCKQTLRNHLAVHTNERQYKCRFCNKCFTQRSPLVLHERKQHTGVKPYPCDVCMEFFESKQLLNKHRQNQHTMVELVLLPQKKDG